MSLWKTIEGVVHNPTLCWTLAQATIKHRRIERRVQESFEHLPAANEHLVFVHESDSWPAYFQHNFFSILFLSIYETIGISESRQEQYGVINHMLRGIVTATDNMIDGEDKGAIELNLRGGRVLRNVYALLMQDDLLHETICAISADKRARQETRSKILGALFEIAEEESEEEEEVDEALPVERLLRQIHSLRGGRLLELSFIAPQVNEEEHAQKLSVARKGIHEIGVGLQILDDVTDLGEDVCARNHNILQSWIVHRETDTAMNLDRLRTLPEEHLDEPEAHFPHAVRSVLEMGIHRALDGFTLLHKVGYCIDRPAATQLVETMFRLRGLENLWELYATDPEPADISPLPSKAPLPASASPER